jgi:hypothetical protein
MSGKTVTIVQSCYIPWKGYFDLIKEADEFVLFDDRQFTRRDWRNRNRIKTPQGVSWLTVPVEVKGRYLQRIDETRVSDDAWAKKHWRTLEHAYASAPFFTEYRKRFASLYENMGDDRLSAINRRLLEEVCDVLGIETKFSWSTDYDVEGDRTQRLVELCQAAGADVYLSGPRARAYLEEQLFADAGIAVRYFDYDGYPEYPQLHPPFVHEVTVLDLIFNTGPSAPQYLKSFSAAVPHG